MSSLIDAAFAALDPAEWGGAAAPARMPLATVRDRLRHGLCPGCGRRPPRPRHVLCGACHDAGRRYCSRCETVHPLAAMTPARRKAAGTSGYCRACHRDLMRAARGTRPRACARCGGAVYHNRSRLCAACRADHGWCAGCQAPRPLTAFGPRSPHMVKVGAPHPTYCRACDAARKHARAKTKEPRHAAAD